MKYDEAIKLWGKQKIEGVYMGKLNIDPETVSVEFDFNEGYACCGGRDPDCYCSFAESPSANVKISGKKTGVKFGQTYSYTIDQWSFDFAEILAEIVAIGGGTISAD